MYNLSVIRSQSNPSLSRIVSHKGKLNLKTTEEIHGPIKVNKDNIEYIKHYFDSQRFVSFTEKGTMYKTEWLAMNPEDILHNIKFINSKQLEEDIEAGRIIKDKVQNHNIQIYIYSGILISFLCISCLFFIIL